MKRTPQRSLLLFWLIALAWGGGIAAIAWVSPAQPVLLLTAWCAGAALLLLLALYLGLAFRLDLLQVQQALRETWADPQAQVQGKSALAPLWWPLIEAVAAQQLAAQAKPAAAVDGSAAQSRAQIDGLQNALAAERAQASAWQQQAAQAQAELGLLRRQAQDAAQELAPVESALAAAELPPGTVEVEETQWLPQSDALGALAATLARLKAEFAAHARAANQQETAGAAQTQARAEQYTQAVEALHQSARQLRQAVDDLQLFGLNLRLQLSHLASTPGAEAAVLSQTEADLDRLLGGLRNLGADFPPLHPATGAADLQEPEPLPQVRAQLLEHLESATAQINAIAQDLAARRASSGQERVQWHAAAQQQARQLAPLQQQLQRLRHVLQQAAQKKS